MATIQQMVKQPPRVDTSGDRRLDAVLVTLVVGFAVMGLRPLIDPDLWWHLRTGELVVESGFPGSDPWSFASTNDWLLHEWASEVVMYLSYALGGYRGVILLHAIMMLLLATILVRSIRAVSGPAVAIPVSFLTLVGVFLGTAERPQLASWVLLAALLPALRRQVDADRPCWWLIPVTCAWANVHGLWIIAIGLFGALVVGRAIDRGLGTWRLSRPQVLVGALSVAAAGLTPNGPRLLLEPFHVRGYAQFVGEWGPPNIQNPLFASTFVLLGVLLVAWARGTGRVPFIDICLAVSAAVIGFSYIRTMPVLAIAVAPLAAQALQQLRTVATPRQPPAAFDRRAVLASVIAFAALATAWLPFVPTTKSSAPWEASAALDALPGRARVLNQYDLGGWLLWTARDSSPVIDGRTEIYSIDHVSRTLNAIDMQPGWRNYVRSHRFDAALLREGAPLTQGLKSLGWTVAADDHRAVVLVPPVNR